MAARQIFINLPVADVAKSTVFYTAIGATKNPQFSDDTASCMVFSDAIFVMLLSHDKWKTFTKRPITDTKTSGAAMYAITCEDRAAVDAMNGAAEAQGGKADINPKQDLGFMYNRSFADLDGHIWEAFFMDMSQVPKG